MTSTILPLAPFVTNVGVPFIVTVTDCPGGVALTATASGAEIFGVVADVFGVAAVDDDAGIGVFARGAVAAPSVRPLPII